MAGSFLTSDLADLLQTTEFATASTFGAATINVILDREYIGQDLATGEVAIESTAPIAYCRSADVSSASQGDTITIPSGGTAYTVVGVEPDFTGMTLLRLRV
jgi:hypothetical protein